MEEAVYGRLQGGVPLILVSPWARNTTEGKPSPKNYSHWKDVVDGLSKAGHELVQVSCSGEPDVQGTRRANDLPFGQIAELLKTCETWLAPDNFLPHLAWTIGQPGVVIFGPSSPDIFGHPENINLLKDRRFLRVRQFGLWSQENPNPDAFVAPEIVISAAQLSIERRRKLITSGPGR